VRENSDETIPEFEYILLLTKSKGKNSNFLDKIKNQAEHLYIFG
jgi:hypothetical protein